jgi:hypothetical protein
MSLRFAIHRHLQSAGDGWHHDEESHRKEQEMAIINQMIPAVNLLLCEDLSQTT